MTTVIRQWKDIEVPEQSNAPLLNVENLSVAYGGNDVVRNVTFSLARGESLALIGESGSGKSTIAKSILKLLGTDNAKVTGSVRFEGQELLGMPERQFRPLRGWRLGYIPQDPGSALNPVRTIGSQAQEAAALLGETNPDTRRSRILDVLAQVGLNDPVRVYGSYPHQLSGGMLQRVLIGLTVLPRPTLIVADEPTSALDVTVQKLTLDLLTDLQQELDISLLLITHDLAIAAERANTLVVLKDGTIQETGASRDVFRAPRSEYARSLYSDVPALNPDRYRSQRLLPDNRREESTANPPRIQMQGVTKSFTTAGQRVLALDGVSFSVNPGTTHALVGESGSGKTTAARLLLGLEQPSAGDIRVNGDPIQGRPRSGLRNLRRHLQLVYQNPFTSLDPTWRVGHIVGEPLDQFGVGGTKSQRARQVREALEAVGLPESFLARRPAHLSGGQRQRVAIARALVLHPDIVVLDEPTSALDVSVQAGILELLAKLQRDRGLTYLFVSHDLALVRQIADTVSVLRHGKVVEEGPVERVFVQPQHAYTRALLAAIPSVAGSETPATPIRSLSEATL